MSPKKRPRMYSRELALERVNILWKQSLEIVDSRPDLAKRWMTSARRIAQRAGINLPREISRSICKGCGTILISGRTCRTRIRNNRSTHLTFTCLDCGKVRRIPIIQQG